VSAFAAPGESKSTGPVVETTEGKVRGVLNNGVHVYRRIPYSASTAGSNRFMRPRKPEPWAGVRDAFQKGHSSPQVPPVPGAIGWGLQRSAQQGEDCLVLNVFTNGVNDGRKRPVTMWIHGSGYTYGSGSSLGYDGVNLARTCDVVVVCIDDRLNIVGHLYLGGAGTEYADSGNAGLLATTPKVCGFGTRVGCSMHAAAVFGAFRSAIWHLRVALTSLEIYSYKTSSILVFRLLTYTAAVCGSLLEVSRPHVAAPVEIHRKYVGEVLGLEKLPDGRTASPFASLRPSF
jgi:hypothetical protein